MFNRILKTEKPMSWWRYSKLIKNSKLVMKVRSKSNKTEVENMITKIRDEGNNLVFTDGSCKDGTAGAAFSVEEKQQNEYLVTNKYVEVNGITAQTAEIYALEKALEWLNVNNDST